MKYTSKHIIAALLLLSGYLFSVQAYAKLNIKYAGIAYMGNFSAKDLLYKYSSRFIDQNEAQLNLALKQRINQIDNENFNIDTDDMKLIESLENDAVTMAFALEYENISQEKIGNAYKVDIDLRANILVFDFKNMNVIAAYPVAIQFRDVFDNQPTESELQNIIRDLYIGDSSSLNIFDEFTKRLSSLNIKKKYAETIKVRSVELLDGAKSNIPGIEREYAENDYKAYLAQMFSTSLSKNHDVSVLPYTVGHAIGNKMPLKIANGNSFNLTVPTETYTVDIVLRKLKKADIGSNEYKTVWGYASFFGIKLSIPGENDFLLDAKFRGMVKKSILKSVVHKVDDWSIYKESMYVFFDELTKNIKERDSDWLAGATATEHIVAQLESFDKIIQACK